MAHIFEATIVYMEQAVEELSSSPLYIRKLGESLAFRDFIQFLSTGAPHITAPILKEGVQTCAAQTKKLEEEKKAKWREASIDDRPESSKRPKIRHTDKATSLEEQRRFFNLQAKSGTGLFTPHSTAPSTSDGSTSRSASRNPEQLDEHDHVRKTPELNGEPEQNQPTPMPDDESKSDEDTPESDEESGQDEEIPKPVAEVIQSEAISESAKQPVKQIDSQSGNQTGEQPGNGKGLPELASELDQNETAVGAATGSNETILVHTASISKTRTIYEKEFGIMSANAAVVDPMKHHCFTFQTFDRRRHFNVKQEINDMFSECQKHLVFFRVKKELLRYLKDRKAVPGSRIEIPSTWNMTDPGEIFGALKTITSKSWDAKIRRAYAQMKIYYPVNEKIASGFEPVNHGHLYDERDYLHELGLGAAERWLDVVDWFDGPAIALIFVIAGIGSSYLAKDWREFKQYCLQYISESLYSIKGLVRILGSEALEQYCRDGYLGQEYITKIERYKGVVPGEEFEYRTPEHELRPLDSEGHDL